MTKRRLTPEEAELWKRVTEQTSKLHANHTPPELPLSKPKVLRTHVKFEPFDLGTKAKSLKPKYDVLSGLSEQVGKSPVAMDRKSFTKMKRGKLGPEGKIDLHGMTVDQAHPALTRFLLRAQADGKRLVLVITGKGKAKPDTGPIPVRHGVLKHQVPQWLKLAPLSQIVLQVSEAHISHGGTGAYYIYLRRNR